MSTKKIRDINDTYQNDSSIQLMSIDDSSPFVNTDVAAARDGTNQLFNSSGEVSYTSSWISVTTPDVIRPNDWEWTTKISSTAYVPMDSLGFHPVTATEWNNFTKRINEFRAYTGYSDYSFSIVSRGQEFTPTIYNQAVNAIKGISGYGSYLSTISKGTELTANLLLSLRDELNAIP